MTAQKEEAMEKKAEAETNTLRQQEIVGDVLTAIEAGVTRQ